MTKWWPTTEGARRWLTAGVFLLLFPAESSGYLKDPGSPPDLLVDSITDDLDRNGIDTRRRWTGLTTPDPSRPQVARIGGYPNGGRGFVSAEWMKEFEVALNSHGHLIAVKPGAGVTASSVSPSQFMDLWNSTERSQRIFLSFTRSDAHHAEVVKSSLEKRGYVVFTYVEGGAKKPPFTPRAVGIFFRTAGNHLVIDTPAARGSIGVALENHSFRVIAEQERARKRERAEKTQVAKGPGEVKTKTVIETKPTVESKPAVETRPVVASRIPSFDLVPCYCGGVFVGMRSASACSGPC